MTKIESIVKLFEKEDFDGMLDALYEIHPKYVYKIGEILFNEGEYDYYDDFISKMDKKQLEKWKTLGSSKRTAEYLLKIPDSEFSDEDMELLRSCDF